MSEKQRRRKGRAARRRLRKVHVLRLRPGADGPRIAVAERRAAEPALERRDAKRRGGWQQPKPKQRLTDAVVKRLAPPAKGYAVTRDTEVRGFAVRVTAKGARSFVLDYYTRGGRDRCFTIGQFPDWAVTAARAKARELRRDIDDGGDPLADVEAERAAPTVWELCDRFQQEHLPRKRPRTAEDYRRMLAIHVRPHFGPHAKVADIAFADVDALHRKITKSGAPYAANRCVAIVSKMLSLSVRWGYRETNPARGIERNVEYGRRRYMSGDELGRLVAALAAHPDKQAADAVRLLLLTGARRMEVLSARWGDIDLGAGVWSKPASSTKQKEHHEAPLSAPARALLSRIQEEQADKRRLLPTWVFPSAASATGHRVELKKDWAQLCKAAEISGLRLHDLRHSYASALISGGASLPLVGAMLGHSSPATTARYAHMFADPMKTAAERIGSLIENAAKPPAPEKVVPLKRGGAS
jgi:integrase